MLYLLLEHRVTFPWETKLVNNYIKYFFFWNNKIKVFISNNNTQKLKWRLLKTPKRIIVHIICPSPKSMHKNCTNRKNITNQQITPSQLEIGVLLEHYNFLWSNAPGRWMKMWRACCACDQKSYMLFSSRLIHTNHIAFANPIKYKFKQYYVYHSQI